MQTVEHTITLHSAEALHGKMPGEFGAVLARVADLAREAVRMRFEGVSSRRGRRPDWLPKAADIRFCDHEGNGDGVTRLFYEAPRLRDTAPDTLWQRGMFGAETPDAAPRKDDTPLDLLADTMFSVRRSDADSRFFDEAMLKDIRGLHKAFGRVFERADLHGNRVAKEQPAIADATTIQNARKLGQSTPRPRKVQLLGKLDMVRHSTSMFGLVVQGAEVACILDHGDIEALSPLLGSKILVQGNAVFRPSGRVLRIEVDHFERGEGKATLFEKLPQPLAQKLDRRRLQVEQGPRSGINAIFGTWPGDETEEEFLAAISEPQE
ncbi:MAG: hypothetical protein HS108_16100 [Planctomycetes bacterium]|jgi:hypothetical protein|nr:hypothetical protein [Planctomycetota bacterium]MCL4730000.1 hypothetical protein [Planctomycetota bacterium]